jgi:hypothetical protein
MTNNKRPATPQPRTTGTDTTHPAGVPLVSTGETRLAFSPDETAELLGISPELVFDLIRTGQLKSIKAGDAA